MPSRARSPANREPRTANPKGRDRVVCAVARLLYEELQDERWGLLEPSLFRDVAEGRLDGPSDAASLSEVLGRLIDRLELEGLSIVEGR